MPYRLAADLILILHTAFIAFVIVALLLTVIGWFKGWQWVRNRWFRGLHLLFIAYVILEAWLAIACPLTIWESKLRVLGGQEPYDPDGFIAHWLHRVIFFRADPWVFTTCYTLFGLLVVVMMLLAPPRWRRQSNDLEEPPSTPQLQEPPHSIAPSSTRRRKWFSGRSPRNHAAVE